MHFMVFRVGWIFLTPSLRIRLMSHAMREEFILKHFLTYLTLQGTLIKLNICLCKVEDHENHLTWVYLTAVLNIGGSRKHTIMTHHNKHPVLFIACSQLCHVIQFDIHWS